MVVNMRSPYLSVKKIYASRALRIRQDFVLYVSVSNVGFRRG